MIQQGGQNGGGDWVVVHQPGVARLAGTAIEAVSASARTRQRGNTMIGLAATAAAWRADAEAEVEEPDGTKWSLKITVKDSVR
jgi:hypothetical protein